MKSKRSKACDISDKVKKTVSERDNATCLLCGRYGAPSNAHFIRRSRMGLGIEQNVLTLCQECHSLYDSGRQDDSDKLHQRLKAYLISKYPGWNEQDLIYSKWK